MKRLLLVTGLLLLFATEILRVYFIMPFPGSQRSNSIDLAYFIHHNRIYLRLTGLLLVCVPLYAYLIKGRPWSKVLLSVVLVFYGITFYFFNFRFEADKMFYQPGTVKFADSSTNNIPLDKLVIGAVLNNEAKAYPIQVIGYHHQIRDSLGGMPVMITYCTVCRTGRVFLPHANGKNETFRLVGMDHFNAMFEDATTRSWWQQATGKAVAGPLKNKGYLFEINSQQSSLGQWLALYPDSKILQPDTVYKKQYEDLSLYDAGTIKGGLERRDSASWKAKSWVIGLRLGEHTKAYDWNQLVSQFLIQDTVGSVPILIALGPDSTSFHAWQREDAEGRILQFQRVPPGQMPRTSPDGLLRDTNTGSVWNFNGKCLSGPLKDKELVPIQSYQEFWHSWSYFHPATTRHTPPLQP